MRKQADFYLVLLYERIYRTFEGGKQMNTVVAVCASSYRTVQWPDIKWARCIRNVRRLQMRIVKATQGGSWNKVKVLQRLLTSSFSSKAIAVKRVTENKGKRTSGVDRQLWSTPENKSHAVQSLNRRGYKPLALRGSTFQKAIRRCVRWGFQQ